VTTQTTSQLIPDGRAGESFSVALEGVVYTLVDVHEGHDEDFERWYESDHFYAGGVLAPYTLSGRRWYAGKALRESRFVSADCPLPDPYRGTNLATYFLTTGGLVGFYDWIVPQLMNLRSAGRMFADRTHINTDGYRLEKVLTFDGSSSVPAHVALDHPFAGVFVAYLDPTGPAAADSSVALPAGTLALSFRPNVGSLTAESIGVSASQPGMEYPSTGEPVRLVLAFLTEPPAATREYSADLSDRLARLTGSRPQWGGGMLPVVPGSREHLAALR
jgi:hypothetical protein